MRPLVLFHGNCIDGFTAAWVAERALGGADIVPCSYGAPLPDVTGRDVFVLDFSAKREQLLTLKAQARSLLLLDHHKTAQADCEGLDFCVFDMARSGAMLAWDYFHPATEAPDLVKFVQDRDLWTWAIPGSKAVSAFISSKEKTLENWDEMAEMVSEDLEFRGHLVIDYQNTQVAQLVKNAFEVSIAGYEVLAVNSPVLQSEIGEKLAEGRPFGACFFQRSDEKVQWSLRSRPPQGVDVSEVAKRFGGGGHATAAGFESKDFSLQGS